MKTILIVMILLGLDLSADYVQKTIVVCASEKTFTEVLEYSKDHVMEKGGLDIELWLMNHECKIIDKKTEIEVLDYTGKTMEFLKLKLKKTGEIVYSRKHGVQIEQPGQKNVIYKF